MSSTPKTTQRQIPAWIIGPACLVATAIGLLFVFGDDPRLFGWALGSVFAVMLLWIIISILFPGSVDRRCPACAEDRLESLNQTTTRGIRCAACGFVDEEASSFYYAEESGSLITIVRREAGLPATPTGNEPAPAGPSVPSEVGDTSAPPTPDQP